MTALDVCGMSELAGMLRWNTLAVRLRQIMTETTWEYVIRDCSPLLTYHDHDAGILDGSQGLVLDPAWKRSCPFRTSVLWVMGKGVCDLCSTHTTNVSGASVSLAFIGEQF